MSNSIDYTTISNQPHQISSSPSKPQPPKETIFTNQYHLSNDQVTQDESDQDAAAAAAAAAPKTKNAAAGDAAATTTPWSRYEYRECQKNHVASMGRYVVDGCGEFMPSGEEGTAQALKCAACECHRSFHRRDTKDADSVQQQLIFLANNQYTNHHYPSGNEINTGSRRPERNHNFRPSTMPLHHQDSHIRPETMPSGGLTDSSSEALNMFRVKVRGREKTMTDEDPSSKKRFRTKFSKEQKVRMQQVAEEMGWKIQNKEDEEQVKQLCDELGVKRQVFKIWMHNNKQKYQHNEVDG
ncbi:Zinc-finger homeodomain protein 6 [Heracleum sosnowskyi]|uniref:Zinc-finger homeodomain protein 6 n=1 Tax=Heracleum sosnowskyi TaxID=360622 RepID=A0AAD8M1V8_9APIA|nr:Zinc-finger homeodomain protein 6 [Heracleum sosnowskyi]